VKVKSAKSICGTIKLPGDKSISHRAAIFAAMAEGETRIENFATNADCASTLNCLRELGIPIRQDGSTVFVEGVGKTGFSKPSRPLDCGNSGTTMRLLAGVLAGQEFDSVLIGDDSLQMRPMRRIIEPLELMGTKIESANGKAPLRILAINSLKAINYKLPIASAQIKSCVLLAGLNANGQSKVQSPKSKTSISPSRDHTELMLKYLNAKISEEFIRSDDLYTHSVSISGDSKLVAADIFVPADISSAAYFLVAAGCLGGSKIILRDVGLNETRSAIIQVLKRFGVNITAEGQRKENGETFANLRVNGGMNLSTDKNSDRIDGDIIANIIDDIPILAVFGTQTENGLEIRDAAELRVKESDRIAAICENLRRMSANVEEFEDGFRVGKSDLKGAKVDSFGDHRIAMAFSIAGLFAEGETEIIDADCVKISFPEFFQVLEDVVT